jgi:hypothetical protein
MRQRNIIIFALLAVLILIVGVAAAGPNTAIFRAIIVTNDAAVGNDLVVGNDITIDGDLTVTGGITGTNVLTTGNQTVGGIKTLTSVLPANAGITVDSTAFTVADTTGNVATTGTLVVGGTAKIAGALNSVVPVLTKDADYAVLVADSGAIIKNTSVVSATFTLPAAAAGLNYCVFNYSGSDVIIEFTDDADVALNEVNSAGDSVTNTTAYDHICLTAIDAINWVTGSSIGTWADGN